MDAVELRLERPARQLHVGMAELKDFFTRRTFRPRGENAHASQAASERRSRSASQELPSGQMVKSSHGIHILRYFRVRAEGGGFGPRILLHHGRRPVKGGLRLPRLPPSPAAVSRTVAAALGISLQPGGCFPYQSQWKKTWRPAPSQLDYTKSLLSIQHEFMRGI